MRRLGFAWLTSALLMPLWASQAHTCSCMPDPPAEEAFAKATLVFVGKVVAMDSRSRRAAEETLSTLWRAFWDKLLRREAREDVDGENRLLRVWLEVSETFKGAHFGDLAQVRTGFFEDECGFEFQPGREYLVYGSGKEGLRVSWCSRTRRLDEAEADLAVLRGLRQ